MRNLFKILILLCLGGFFSCSQENDNLSDLKTIEIGKYKLETPSHFELKEEQGYDSYIGKIQGSGITISFDYGIYSRKDEIISENDFELINEVSNGYSKQILIARNPEIDYTSLHISQINQEINNTFTNAPLKMWSTNLSTPQQKLVIAIFESVEELQE